MMGKARKSLLAGAGRGFQPRVLGLVRPGVETMLLAAVALGCAQAGWAVLAPDSAGASNSTTSDGPDLGASNLNVGQEIRSPFAPAYGDGDASHAAAAMLASVQLNAVRVAEGDARSGAYLTLSDGAQRAFAVGQEIAPGLTLQDVQSGYVTVSYAGGARQIAMAAPANYSFAQAMMGRGPAPDGAAPTVVSDVPLADAGGVQLAAADASDEAAAWLTSLLGHVEGEGQARGWRVPGEVPALAKSAGLREGDLIVSVNGIGPDDPSALLGELSKGEVALEIRRAAGERLTVTLTAARPT